MQIDDLIERVRGLTGPDRETDAEIWRFTDPDDALAKAWPVKGMMYAGHVHTKAEKAAYIKLMTEFYAAPVTASLDAAVALVEKRDPERAVEHLKSAIEQVVKSNLSLADLPRFVIISLLTGVQNNEG